MKRLSVYRPGSNRLRADLSGKYSGRGPLLLLMRHGRADTGPVRRFIGQTDLPLDAAGKGQARAWLPELARIPLSCVHVSALARTRQTAALCCPDRPALVDPRLNEIHLGSWDGETFDHIQSRFPGEFQRRGREITTYRPPGGECFQDLCNRALPFFEGLERQMAAPEKKRQGHSLVITHAGVIRTLSCRWEGAPMDRLFDYTPGYGEIWAFGAG